MISAHPVSLLSAVDTTPKIKKIKTPRVSTPSAADTCNHENDAGETTDAQINNSKMINAHRVPLLSAVDTTTKIKKIKAPRILTPSASDTTKSNSITSDNEIVSQSRDLPLSDAGVTHSSNNEMINAHRMSLPASNPIGWKLSKIEFTDTIFNKKKMREYANIGMVHGFISNEMGISMFDYKRYDGMLSEIHTELDLMRAFRERYKKNHFSVAHKLPKHGWGRTIPCDYLSLSIMRRGTRHALCNSIYRDLDLVNAHATIIYEIGTQNQLPLPFLKQIVDDPKGWRKTICEHHGLDFNDPTQRDVAKTLPLSLFFGGAYKVWIRENNITVNEDRLLPVLIGVENELRNIREIVFTNNTQISKDVTRHNVDKWKDTNAAKRGVMAMWAQTIERRIMEDAVTFLVEKRNFKLEDIVPCQDGLMILKELFYEGIERDFEQLAHEKYGFHHLRWVEKPFDEAIEIPVNSDIVFTHTVDWSRLTEAMFAKKMCELYFNDKVIFENDGKHTGFFFNGVYWQPTEKHDAMLKKEYFLKLYDWYTNELNLSDMEEKTRKSIAKQLQQLDKSSFRRGVIDIIRTENTVTTPIRWNHNPDLFAFTDVTYDLAKGEVKKPDPADFINCTCGYNYFEEYDDKGKPVEKVYAEEKAYIDRFVSSICATNEVKEYLFVQCSTFLKQCNSEERAYFWLGRGRNGKGTLTALLKMALGNYFGELNLTYYTSYEKTADAPNNNLFMCRHARMLSTSEIGENEQNTRAQTFNTAKFRTITGGDPISVRQLHDNNQVSFTPGPPVIQTNVMPIITGIHDQDNVALRERFDILDFVFSFTSDEAKIAADPARFKMKDITLKNRFSQPAYRNAMIRLLFENYKMYRANGIVIPQAVKDRTQQYFAEADVVRTWFWSTLKEHKNANFRGTDREDYSRSALCDRFRNDVEPISSSVFNKRLKAIVGERDPADKNGTRGLYNLSNKLYLQGYSFIADEENAPLTYDPEHFAEEE